MLKQSTNLSQSDYFNKFRPLIKELILLLGNFPIKKHLYMQELQQIQVVKIKEV